VGCSGRPAAHPTHILYSQIRIRNERFDCIPRRDEGVAYAELEQHYSTDDGLYEAEDAHNNEYIVLELDLARCVVGLVDAAINRQHRSHTILKLLELFAVQSTIRVETQQFG
jgi:hypothetical protein